MDEKRRLGYFEGTLSAVLNTLLFGFKIWVGAAAGSVAMIADAWHTMSDTLTSLVVILGFWISGKPGDRKHPFGHGRAELVAAVVIGTLLGVVGVNFLRDSAVQLRERRGAEFDAAALVVFGVSVILKEAIARFSIRAGRRVKSQSLVADGWHHRSDALASALILAGALLQRRFWWIDGVLGIGVSLLILYAAYSIIREAADTLLGECPDEDTVRGIREILARLTPEATDIHHIHIHRYGDHVEVTLHIRMPPEMSVREAHGIATSLETELRQTLGWEATVHPEPRQG